MGPARIGNDTFVGMKALVFGATVGKHCVIKPGCIIMWGLPLEMDALCLQEPH